MTLSTRRAYSRLEREARRLLMYMLMWSAAVRQRLTSSPRIVYLSTRSMSGHSGAGCSAITQSLRERKTISSDATLSCNVQLQRWGRTKSPLRLDVGHTAQFMCKATIEINSNYTALPLKPWQICLFDCSMCWTCGTNCALYCVQTAVESVCEFVLS